MFVNLTYMYFICIYAEGNAPLNQTRYVSNNHQLTRTNVQARTFLYSLATVTEIDHPPIDRTYQIEQMTSSLQKICEL